MRTFERVENRHMLSVAEMVFDFKSPIRDIGAHRLTLSIVQLAIVQWSIDGLKADVLVLAQCCNLLS